MNIRRSAVAFVAIALLLASAAHALDVPSKPTQWVNDYGTNLVSADDVRHLNEKLEGLYKKTGTQFLIMLFPSLEGEDDLGYTNRVANVWKVSGDKALMLFVFAKEHRVRIQVGYGLEAVITDAYSSRIIRETITPRFKQNDFAGGLDAGIDALTAKIDPNAVGATSGPAASPQRTARSSQGSGPNKFVLLVLFWVVIFVLLPMFSRGLRRRGRGGCGGCNGCLWPMFFGGWGGGGGTTFGGGGWGGGGGGGWSTGGSWGGGGSSFGGGGAGGGW